MEQNLLSNILYSTEVTNEQNRALLVLLSKQTALLVEISQGLKEISAKIVSAKSTDVNQMTS
jgi:hypothetical protein